jgi:pimeloyl-ACP methyl ester carboxylesterase
MNMRVLWMIAMLGCVSGAEAAAAINWTPEELVARGGAKAMVERGEIMVPESRARAGSRMLRLSFVRFPALKPSGQPPIVYLAGGPGGSGIDAARMPARFAIFMALRENADVIALDQRGTGSSTRPPDCPATVQLPVDKPTTSASLTTALREAGRACAQFWKQAGVDLAGYNTWESAADVESLREALGVPQLALWGISYGSHLGLAIMKRYPDRIARGAFVGIEGLDETVKSPALTDGFLARLQAAVLADPAAAKAYPDFLGTMRRVHERLEKAPVTVQVKDGAGNAASLALGRVDVQLAAAMLSSDPARSRMLPGLYAMMDAGDYSRTAEMVWEFIHKPGATSLDAMSTAMDVASGISASRLREFRREAATSLLGETVNFPMPQLVDERGRNALGVPDLGERFRTPYSSDIPVLFLSGTLDGRTYPESARAIAGRFRNSRHVMVTNGGHNLFEATPRVGEMIAAWFRGEEPAVKELALPPPEFPH